MLSYDKKQNWLESVLMVSQLGLTMCGSILFCLFVGKYLDNYFEYSGFFTFLFLLFGIIGGGNVCYRQILIATNSEKDLSFGRTRNNCKKN